jgi:hypothetical protein
MMVKAGWIATASLALMLVSVAQGFSSDTGEPGKSAPIRIDRAHLQKSTEDDELAFTVTISEPGEYEVALEVEGRFSRGWVVNLVMEPEAGGVTQQAIFSNDGKHCG